MISKYLVVVFSCISMIVGEASAQSPDPVVDVGVLGRIQGMTAETVGTVKRPYNLFLGIPYANEPQRFKPTELKEELLSSPGGTFLAQSFGSMCPQPSGNGSEECHFLNLSAPQEQNPLKPYPVIVFVHGAGFIEGNANGLNGSRLLKNDIILVTMNYRLGIFGALNMGTDTAPGNGGLYDVLTVLRWVQKFVHHFNGDPNLVTLAGQSSGSATVSHLLLSPLTKGLIHRVIAASGSGLDFWATSPNPLESAMTVAAVAGCTTNVMECMLNKTQFELTVAQNITQFLIWSSGALGFGPISPSVQSAFLPASTEILVSEHPALVLEKGQQNNIPLMMSVTKEDGGFAYLMMLQGYIVPNNLINNTQWMRDELVPQIFRAIGFGDPSNTLANEFTKTYIDEQARQIGNLTELMPTLIDMLSVLFFKSSSHRTVQKHARINANTYFHSFEYTGEYSFGYGVAHGEDLIYLFHFAGELNAEDQALSDIMVDYWTNFAYNGNPNAFPEGVERTVPNWPAVQPNDNSYLVIDNNGLRASTNYPDSWVIQNKKASLCSNSKINSLHNFAMFSLPILLFLQM